MHTPTSFSPFKSSVFIFIQIWTLTPAIHYLPKIQHRNRKYAVTVSLLLQFPDQPIFNDLLVLFDAGKGWILPQIYTSLTFVLGCIGSFFSGMLFLMKIDRVKMQRKDFYQPFKEDELEQSTKFQIIFPVEPKPIIMIGNFFLSLKPSTYSLSFLS